MSIKQTIKKAKSMPSIIFSKKGKRTERSKPEPSPILVAHFFEDPVTPTSPPYPSLFPIKGPPTKLLQDAVQLRSNQQKLKLVDILEDFVDDLLFKLDEKPIRADGTVPEGPRTNDFETTLNTIPTSSL
ncbi:hypothetical protein GALMADRAFT_138640 [Galerina marginata CBS 339.88]|uniref:Uncharacterized protein n=1 Tax=Galerina marginata (strain CBS 339.88) TaxID=685588 RepID=A0A067TCE0_GALM3|nr:hypothetical protein GALMADRAFT_138640 [Galerina marginata CBS 339.88]